MHWRSFAAGVAAALLLIGGIAAWGASRWADSLEIVMPVDVDSYVSIVGQELASAVIAVLPSALADIRGEVPDLVRREMAGTFGSASLDIGGWKIRIPDETLRELDEGLQDMVRDCIFELLDGIDSAAIASKLQAECEQRLRSAAVDFAAWDAAVVLGPLSLPVRFRPSSPED